MTHAPRNAPQDSPPETPGEGSGEGSEASDYLARYRDGDVVAFDQLFEAYEARLVQFFYRLCWDRSRAEDLTQNLFLKLLRKADRYSPEGRLSTFIFRVATNLWIDHYRADRPRRRLFSLDQALLGGEQPVETRRDASPVAVAELDEDKRRMRDALEQLTEPHRLVFELAVYQELPYAEVSGVLGIPVGTVKSRMHNSVKALRKLLDEPKGGRATHGGSSGVGSSGPDSSDRGSADSWGDPGPNCRQDGGVGRRPFRSGGIA